MNDAGLVGGLDGVGDLLRDEQVLVVVIIRECAADRPTFVRKENSAPEPRAPPVDPTFNPGANGVVWTLAVTLSGCTIASA